MEYLKQAREGARIYPAVSYTATLLLSRLETFFVVYFILSRLLYLAFSANLGLLCMPHPGIGTLV